MGNDFKAPEVEKVIKTVISPAPLREVKEVPAPYASSVKALSEEPTFKPDVADIVKVADMLDFKGDAVSDVFKAALARYTSIILKQRSVKDLQHEQVSFMETVNNSLSLEFKQYAMVTDYFIEFINKNPEAFSKKKIFSLLAGVGSKYNETGKRRFTYYMTALTTLATAGVNRKRVSSMVDINTLVQSFTPKAKQNITTYFIRAYAR